MIRKLALAAGLIAFLVLVAQSVEAPAYAEARTVEVVTQQPLTVPDPAGEETGPGVMTHGIIHGCGVLWSFPHLGRPYCDLGQQGQQYAFRGSAAAIASAICTFGPVPCAVAVALAAIAVAYVADHGICRGNLRVAARPSGAWCV
jgi:hypothetical protein